jgi:hypothetical protein
LFNDADKLWIGQNLKYDMLVMKWYDIELKGMKTVVDEYTVPGYTVGKYKAPGSIE